MNPVLLERAEANRRLTEQTTEMDGVKSSLQQVMIQKIQMEVKEQWVKICRKI